MNIHHLELFYYVARHGGISEAARNIPYGIQQPAVSAQILQLEDTLGLALFQRRPFSLTPEGQKLYKFIQPFFENLDAVAEELRGGPGPQIRIGASQIVLRDHVPLAMQEVRKKFPKIRLTLREAYQPQLESWLERQEIDLALTVLETKPRPGIHALSLVKLPLVLLVPEKSPITSARELWRRDKITEPLLCLPANELICKNFQQGLARLGLDWYPSTELSSLELVETLVRHQEGIGLSVVMPGTALSPGLRVLSLEGFPEVDFGLLWRGKANPVIEAFVAAFKRRAQSVVAGPVKPVPARAAARA